jgi:beta-N-acetylhexosaminidase
MIIFASVLQFLSVLLASPMPIAEGKPVFQSNPAMQWADSVLTTLSAEEKIGQLFMVAAYSNKGAPHETEILRLISQEHVGGLIFFQGGPNRQLALTRKYQAAAKVGLLIGIDGEWGLAMRLDSTFRFPWPLTVGAVQDSLLVYQMGKEIGKHHKRLGIHINFAPVADINTNPDNPIINARSFGENRENVLQKSGAYMAGMQSEGVLACAKHFPGHGDTDTDSHLALPVVKHNRTRLESTELFPYKPLFQKGLASVMVAHLAVPALDSSLTPASISPIITQKLLREELGFEGLIITDALNMKGVANSNKPGDIELKAFLAGNDILLFPQDVAKARTALMQALNTNVITETQLNNRVRRILMAKYWAGIHKKQVPSITGLHGDLNNTSAEILFRKLTEESLTLVVNRDKKLPLRPARDEKIAVIGFGTDINKQFADALNLYHPVTWMVYDPAKINEQLNQLSTFDHVIAAFYTSNANPWKSYKPGASEKALLKRLQLQGNVVVNLFANPYALGHFETLDQCQAVLVSYQNTPEAASLSAQLIFGAIQAKGKLPVSSGSMFTAGYGLSTAGLDILRYGIPEEQGIDRKRLSQIDAITDKAIREGAMPGAQVLIAKNGQVIFHKAYGKLSYDLGAKVDLNTIYDLASITKIGASVPALMYMYDEGWYKLDDPLERHLAFTKGSNKGPLTFRNVLAHQAGLKAWLPFYVQTMKQQKLLTEYYNEQQSFEFPHQVTETLFANRHVKDTILKRILESPLQGQSYLYSDLGYYFFQQFVEQTYRKGLDIWMEENFFGPMGAHTLGFNPLDRFPKARIAPTENDKLFRNAMIQGTVHDQGAAMMGGVAGHAGLFSNANDLAKLMQLFVQKGHYNGIQFLNPTTIDLFTSCQFCNDNNNRRGVGFDKPQLSGGGPTCGCVSMLSFGHTGFTGTIAWADPEEKIVYIFLSNRVHPDAENKKLISMGTRTQVQQVIYDALNTYRI